MMTGWVETVSTRAPANRCRFLGELVSLMVAGGHLQSAFELEDAWNQLLAIFPAMLYCIYEQTPFEQLQALNNFCEVCNHHDAVLAAHLRSETSREPSAWFVLLQEQASALREEVMRRTMAERLVYVNEANRLKQLEALLRVHGPNLSPGRKTRYRQGRYRAAGAGAQRKAPRCAGVSRVAQESRRDRRLRKSDRQRVARRTQAQRRSASLLA